MVQLILQSTIQYGPYLEAVSFISECFKQHGFSDDYMQLCTDEGGSRVQNLLECFQWSSEADDEALREELADVMNYCIQLAQKKEYDICEILNDKIDKNEKKYPVDKSRGSSKKYDQLG